MTWMVHAANVVLPGSGLLGSGRALSGGLCLAGALLCGCVLGLAALDIPGFASGVLPALGGYLALGLAGEAWWLVSRRVPVLDAPAVRLAHRAAAAAYLTRDQVQARAAAERLCRLAGREPGSWRLLALILDATPDPTGASRARRRAARLEESA